MGLFGRSKFDRAFAPYEMQGKFDRAFAPYEMQENKPATFWQGGDKFTGRDAIAGLLAAIGDAFTQQGGGRGSAVQMLTGGRMDAMEMARKAAEEQKLMAAAGRQGINADQFALHRGGLGGALAQNDTAADYEFWKQHMSPEQFQAWVQNKADPPQYRQGPDGQFYRITPQTMQPPPITEDDWNKGQPMGGGVGNGAGGFRRFYR